MAGRERTQAYALGWIAGTVVLASFIVMMFHFNDRLPTWLFGPQ